MGKSLKVSVTITLAVDIDAWANEYGFDPADLGGIRAAVKRQVESDARNQLASLGLLARGA